MLLITDNGILFLVLKLSKLIVLFSSTNSFRKNPVFCEEGSKMQVLHFYSPVNIGTYFSAQDTNCQCRYTQSMFRS